MGIDGIGKPPGVGAPPGASGVGRADPAAPARDAFKVEKAGAAEGVAGSDPLSRLQRGEIGVDEYLDQRAEVAVEHLRDKLSAEQLDFVRNSLREQLRTDPVLVELVRRTTGALPSES
jgi:hypothetical protein